MGYITFSQVRGNHTTDSYHTNQYTYVHVAKSLYMHILHVFCISLKCVLHVPAHLQFHRSFPGPPEIKESEISVIAEYYLEPPTGLYNYLRFNSDIDVFQENEALKKKFNEPSKTFSQVCT